MFGNWKHGALLIHAQSSNAEAKDQQWKEII
jgi:hypothetical protein